MMFRRPLVVRRRPLPRAAVVGGGAYALGRHQAKAQAAEEARFEDLEERTAGAEQAAFSSRQAERRGRATGRVRRGRSPGAELTLEGMMTVHPPEAEPSRERAEPTSSGAGVAPCSQPAMRSGSRDA